VLREIVAWRDLVARELDRATFRVMSNEVLLDVARAGESTRESLGSIRGMPRSLLERRGTELIEAIRRGHAVREEDLPRFPRAPRFERDPDFDENVSRLRAVREQAAMRLDLDPGVLCSRERLESIARLQPTSVAQLGEIKELRKWQIAELGAEIVALFTGAKPADSPYAE
jgi:ribonuclease D